MLGAILIILISLPSYADDPRFSRILEFELMYECIGDTRYRVKKTKICACALAKTQENGFWPDYDNDNDYNDDKKEFFKSFQDNINHYIGNYQECENI